jgi:biopolymer transport protein ExbD
LKDKMRKEQKTEILITAHAQSLHRSVISVIDAANSVGMQKIRLVSRQGKSE